MLPDPLLEPVPEPLLEEPELEPMPLLLGLEELLPDDEGLLLDGLLLLEEPEVPPPELLLDGLLLDESEVPPLELLPDLPIAASHS